MFNEHLSLPNTVLKYSDAYYKRRTLEAHMEEANLKGGMSTYLVSPSDVSYTKCTLYL